MEDGDGGGREEEEKGEKEGKKSKILICKI